MQLKTEAVVIDTIRYNEADLIVKLFTRKEGVFSYLVRGILKSKKGKLKRAYFQPLTFLEADVIHNQKGNLCRITDAKPSMYTTSLHTNMPKICIVTFMAEILNQLIPNQQQEEGLFLFLKKMCLWLDTNDNIALIPHYFLLQLSGYLGFYPENSSADLPQFNLEEGKFDVGVKTSFALEGEALVSFSSLMQTTLENLQNLHLQKVDRSQLLQNLLRYYHLHIEGFKKPKSLEVIQQILH